MRKAKCPPGTNFPLQAQNTPLQTAGYRLPCKAVYHSACPRLSTKERDSSARLKIVIHFNRMVLGWGVVHNAIEVHCYYV